MEAVDVPSSGTWSTADTQNVPQAPDVTIDPSLLHFDQSSRNTVAKDGGDSTSTLSPSAHPTTPKRQRKHKKPQPWRQSCQPPLERKYRDKLRAAWTALSNAISSIHALSWGSKSGHEDAAANQTKHTVLMKAVEYIKQLEDENGILLAMLADPLLSDGQIAKRTGTSVTIHDGGYFDDDYIDSFR